MTQSAHLFLNAGRKATAFMSKERKRIANVRFTAGRKATAFISCLC